MLQINRLTIYAIGKIKKPWIRDGINQYKKRMPELTINELKNFNINNLLLFFTGYSREANKILKKQNDETKKNNDGMIENLNFIKKIGLESKKCLEKGDFNKFAELMNIHWEHKQNRSKQMTNPEINKIYKKFFITDIFL